MAPCIPNNFYLKNISLTSMVLKIFKVIVLIGPPCTVSIRIVRPLIDTFPKCSRQTAEHVPTGGRVSLTSTRLNWLNFELVSNRLVTVSRISFFTQLASGQGRLRDSLRKNFFSGASSNSDVTSRYTSLVLKFSEKLQYTRSLGNSMDFVGTSFSLH